MITALLPLLLLSSPLQDMNDPSKSNKERDVNEFGSHERPWTEDLLAKPEDCITVVYEDGIAETAAAIERRLGGDASTPPLSLVRSITDTSFALKAIEAERATLREEWSQLADRKAEALVLEKRNFEEMERLRSLKTEIEALIDEFEQKEDENVEYVARLIENMNAKEAARLLAANENSFVVAVLGKLDERLAGELLARMDDKAAEDVILALAQRGKPTR